MTNLIGEQSVVKREIASIIDHAVRTLKRASTVNMKNRDKWQLFLMACATAARDLGTIEHLIGETGKRGYTKE